jgi:hypothetical protein
MKLKHFQTSHGTPLAVISWVLAGFITVGGFGWPSRTFAGSNDVVANTPAPSDIPSGRLLRDAPAFSQWTIDFTYSEDRSSKTGGSVSHAGPGMRAFLLRPRKTITTKTAEVISVQTVDMAGRMSEIWDIGGTQYSKPGGTNAWFTASASMDRNSAAGATVQFSPMPPNGFNDLDWIGKETYAGKIALGDSECFVFVPGGTASIDLGAKSGQESRLEALPKVAYIDAGTRLPRALRIAGEVRVFQFSTNPPTTVQAFPADLQATIQQADHARTLLLQSAARPY